MRIQMGGQVAIVNPFSASVVLVRRTLVACPTTVVLVRRCRAKLPIVIVGSVSSPSGSVVDRWLFAGCWGLPGTGT